MMTTQATRSRAKTVHVLSLFLLILYVFPVSPFTFGPSLVSVATKDFLRLDMISFGERGSTDESLPRGVKDAVTRCRAATQEALKNRLSRMDIEFPVGTKFGIEKAPKVKAAKEGMPTKDQLDQSDRELARLFVEMFQPVGGENISVAFTEQSLAEIAKKKWKVDAGFMSHILAMNRRKNDGTGGSKKKKASKPRGFAAKMAAEIDNPPSSSSAPQGPFELPPNTEVAIFVAPGPKELVVIDKICQEVGMGTLVILLNARLSKINNFGTDAVEKLFRKDFESVFCLSAAPQDAAPDCLIYRAYPGNWQLARKPAVGQPKTILTKRTKPTNAECQEAHDNLEVGDLEKSVETALENVAGWFR